MRLDMLEYADQMGFDSVGVNEHHQNGYGMMPSPNLMVELSAEQVADLITALTFHIGEVQRNPYHLSLPAWMIDNVRRGAELVGGQGGAAPDFTFGTLYRLRKWTGGKLERVYDGGKFLSCAEKPESLFP